MIDRVLLRSAAVLAVIGALVGVGVALLTHYLLVRRLHGNGVSEAVYHGAYVPLQGIPLNSAYSSTLRISTDPDPSVWPLLGWCLAGGVVLALLVVVALRLTGRRLALVRSADDVSAASPTG